MCFIYQPRPSVALLFYLIGSLCLVIKAVDSFYP
nr:MAG TPA: YrhK-like protein [Bacteriophage sp.]